MGDNHGNPDVYLVCKCFQVTRVVYYLHSSTAGVPPLSFLFGKRRLKLLGAQLKDIFLGSGTVPTDRTTAG